MACPTGLLTLCLASCHKSGRVCCTGQIFQSVPLLVSTGTATATARFHCWTHCHVQGTIAAACSSRSSHCLAAGTLHTCPRVSSTWLWRAAVCSSAATTAATAAAAAWLHAAATDATPPAAAAAALRTAAGATAIPAKCTSMAAAATAVRSTPCTTAIPYGLWTTGYRSWLRGRPEPLSQCTRQPIQHCSCCWEEIEYTTKR